LEVIYEGAIRREAALISGVTLQIVWHLAMKFKLANPAGLRGLSNTGTENLHKVALARPELLLADNDGLTFTFHATYIVA
jgi:hypothetical protein